MSSQKKKKMGCSYRTKEAGSQTNYNWVVNAEGLPPKKTYFQHGKGLHLGQKSAGVIGIFFFSVSVSRQQLKRQTQAGNQLSADHQFKCPGVGWPDDPLAVIIWLGESNYTFQCHFKSGWLCLHSFLAVSITAQLIFFDIDSMWAREEFRFLFTVCSTGKTKKFPRFVKETNQDLFHFNGQAFTLKWRGKCVLPLQGRDFFPPNSYLIWEPHSLITPRAVINQM